MKNKIKIEEYNGYRWRTIYRKGTDGTKSIESTKIAKLRRKNENQNSMVGEITN